MNIQPTLTLEQVSLILILSILVFIVYALRKLFSIEYHLEMININLARLVKKVYEEELHIEKEEKLIEKKEKELEKKEEKVEQEVKEEEKRLEEIDEEIKKLLKEL